MRKNRFLIWSAVAFFLITITSSASANLLTNPNFDTGNLTGWNMWNAGDSGLEVTTSQFQSPSYSLKEWTWSAGVPAEGNTGVWQDFSASENFTYYISAYLKSLSSAEPLRDGATGYLKLEWRDFGGGLIGSPLQIDLFGANDSWELFELSDTAPTGVANGRVVLGLWSPALSGDGRAVYFDDVWADTEPVPEPMSLLMLSFGLLGLGVFSKKNRQKGGEKEDG